ncbi:hypothetical protein C8Q78DRAFT_932613, partial [Trametes maxima]
LERAIRIALDSTIQRRDYALASEGARIGYDLTSSIKKSPSDPPPENVLAEGLQRDMCWLFDGHQGQVAIRLPALISPTHIALDYATSVGMHHRAPRRVILWGLVEGDANRLTYDKQLRDYRDTVAHLGEGPLQSLGYTFLALAHFEYDLFAPFALQTHPVADLVVKSQITFGVVVLEVRSNWGGFQTALCRVRIHG